MKHNPSIMSLLCALLFVGCAPAIDSPKTYDNNTIKFSYPGNWGIEDSGSTIIVQEKLIFGIFPGETSIMLSINSDLSTPAKYEHHREVQTKILDKTVKGDLSFDWIDGLFQTSYFVEKGDHSIRIKVNGTEQALERAEPGIRQVLESLEL